MGKFFRSVKDSWSWKSLTVINFLQQTKKSSLFLCLSFSDKDDSLGWTNFPDCFVMYCEFLKKAKRAQEYPFSLLVRHLPAQL